MGRAHCQSTSQSGERWVVVTPEEREGKIMDKWGAPANLVLTSLTDSANQNSTQTFKAPLLSLHSLPPQPEAPSGAKGLTLPWMPYLLPLEALGDPHSPIFLKLEGDDLSSMSKPRSS